MQVILADEAENTASTEVLAAQNMDLLITASEKKGVAIQNQIKALESLKGQMNEEKDRAEIDLIESRIGFQEKK